MPMVTNQPSRATSTASRTQSRKASGSVTTWSAAKEPMIASGSCRSSSAAAQPIAAIESRGDGSATSQRGSTSGSWAATASRWAAPVTTRNRSAASGASRSTVAWIMVRPDPLRSCRNLGAARLDRGHSRVPAPPAGTTAQNDSLMSGEASR